MSISQKYLVTTICDNKITPVIGAITGVIYCGTTALVVFATAVQVSIVIATCKQKVITSDQRYTGSTIPILKAYPTCGYTPQVV